MCLETFVGAMVSFSAVAKRICAKKDYKKLFFQFCYPSRYVLETMMLKICIPRAWKCKCRIFRGMSYRITCSMKACIWTTEDKIMFFIRLHHVKGLFFPYFDAIFIDISLYYLFDKNIFNKKWVIFVLYANLV